MARSQLCVSDRLLFDLHRLRGRLRPLSLLLDTLRRLCVCLTTLGARDRSSGLR